MAMGPRTRLAAAFVVLLAAPTLAADLAEIRKTGVLRVIVVDGFPVFYSLKPDGPPGLDREILEGFARLQKVKIVTVEAPSWDALVPSLLAGKGDLIAGGVTASESRLKLIAFTAPVFPTRNVVLTRRPHRVVKTLEELREERVGTIKGTTFAEVVAAAQVPPRNVDDSLPADGIPAALRSGKVTACVDGIEDALLLKRADPELQLGHFLGPPQNLAFGIRKDSPVLLKALDEHITNVRRSMAWNRLVVKYFGASALEVLREARAE